MFKNVGKTIKTLAKILMWVGIVCSGLIIGFGIFLLIFGIVVLAGGSTTATAESTILAVSMLVNGSELIVSGVGLILSGILAMAVVIIKILCLYGYGEVIQNSAVIAKNTTPIDSQTENDIPFENQAE